MGSASEHVDFEGRDFEVLGGLNPLGGLPASDDALAADLRVRPGQASGGRRFDGLRDVARLTAVGRHFGGPAASSPQSASSAAGGG